MFSCFISVAKGKRKIIDVGFRKLCTNIARTKKELNCISEAIVVE